MWACKKLNLAATPQGGVADALESGKMIGLSPARRARI